MRIIAGEHRGRKLLPPEGENTRPVTDRVKQSLFDILAPRLDGARVFDCFAGTGSMGLECLSRGSAVVTFFETDRSAVKRLKENVDLIGVRHRSQIVSTDIFRYTPSEIAHGTVDVIFLDPPYRYLTDQTVDLRRLAERLSACLRPDGVLVFRHDAADQLELPPLVKIDERTYGGMTLEFLAVSTGKVQPVSS